MQQGQDPFASLPGGGHRLRSGAWVPFWHPQAVAERGEGIFAPPVTPVPPPSSLAPWRPVTWGRTYGIWPVPVDGGPNANLLDAARAGETLPTGVVTFRPPLVLADIVALRGDRTLLAPETSSYRGPLVVIENLGSLNVPPDLGYPAPAHLEGITIVGSGPGQTGLLVRGVRITGTRLTITGCDVGMAFEWAVNTAWRDCLVSHNRVGIEINGYGPDGLTGPNSVTTLRFEGLRVAASSKRAISIGHGTGIVIRESIIEGNPGYPLYVEPIWPAAPLSVTLRDVWLEQNGRPMHDPYRRVRAEGVEEH